MAVFYFPEIILCWITAILLECDVDDGAPKTIYSLNIFPGVRLSVNDIGQLEWDVESMASAIPVIQSGPEPKRTFCRQTR